MVRRLLLLVILGVMTSGCFVAPLALIGPATSGFTTASLAKSGITSGIDFVIKKRTGKSISQHAFDRINREIYSANKEVLQQTYLPKKQKALIVAP
jgi:hypothetical protein